MLTDPAHQTIVRKSRSGWEATTTMPLGFELEGKPTFLKVITSKNSSGTITAFAAVHTQSGSMWSFRMFHDYSRNILRAPPGTRATEKTIKDLHDEAMRHLDEVLADVRKHYGRLGELYRWEFTEAGRAAGWTREHLGLLPLFLDGEGTAAEQLNRGYQQHAGQEFVPWQGYTLGEDNALHYKGEEPLLPRATCQVGEELVANYDYGLVAVIQPDRSFVACRMD